MELLSQVNHLSGPVSAHAFKVEWAPGKTTTVFLFGDYHFSYDNACQKCSASGGCYDIVKFIRKAEEHCASKQVNLDVFLELPYVSKDRQGMQFIDTYFASNSSAAVKFRNTLSKLMGRRPKVIGMLSKLYTTFKDRIYAHHTKGKGHQKGEGEDETDSKKSLNRQRFHYGDTRFERHAHLISPPMSSEDKIIEWMVDFHTRVATADKFCRILEAFVTSKNFEQDMRKLMGDKTAIVDSALSNVTINGKTFRVHKVAKQYWRVPEELRPIADKYVRDRIEYVRQFMLDVLNYDFHARQFQGLTLEKVVSTRHEVEMAHSLMSAGLMAYMSNLAYPGLMLVCCMIIMDAYMICRMLRYMHESNDGSCVIAYTGDAHTSHYADFMVNYLDGHARKVRVTPVICRAMPENEASDGPQRCISTAAQRCDRKEFDAMVHDTLARHHNHSSA